MCFFFEGIETALTPGISRIYKITHVAYPIVYCGIDSVKERIKQIEEGKVTSRW